MLPSSRKSRAWQMTELNWNQDEPGKMTYHYARISSNQVDDHQAAIDNWWEKLLDLAESTEDWNVIVGDIWVETGRIIGHVQQDNTAIGMDCGFRVALSVSSVVDALHRAEFEPAAYARASDQLYALLDRSAKREPTRQRLVKLNKQSALQLWWCENGELNAVAKTPT